MSVRGDILDTLATQLATITTGNGYNVTVTQVERDQIHTDQITSGQVYLTILDTDPDTPRQYAAGDKVRFDMTARIFAQIKPAATDTPATTDLSDLITDIRKLVTASIALGSYVRYVELGDVGQRIIADDRVMFDYPITIGYWDDF